MRNWGDDRNGKNTTRKEHKGHEQRARSLCPSWFDVFVVKRWLKGGWWFGEVRHRHNFSGDVRAAAGGGRARASGRAGDGGRQGPRPARLHDRPASRGGRRGVRRRTGDGV